MRYLIYLLIGLFVSLPDYGECADPADQNTSSFSRRIVGGDVVSDDDAWPWMAALVESGGGSDYADQFCGGSLIHPQWVLTAAHCVEDDYGIVEKPGNMEVVLGTHDLKNGKGEHFSVKRIIPHPYYADGNSSTPDSDIALLELESPATDYPTLPIYDGSDSLNGREGIVIGWGSTRGWGNLYRVSDPWNLRQVDVPIVSNEECSRAYRAKYLRIDSSMMCAGFIEGGKDSCQGDSGGPLIVQDKGIWKQAGVVSQGIGCAEPGLYGVYSRISALSDFIYSNTGIRTFPEAPIMSLKTSGTEITISWDPVSGAEGYRLYYAPYPNADAIHEAYADMGLVRELSGPLPPASAYYAAVQAYNGEYSGNLSDILFFMFIEGTSAFSLTVRTGEDSSTHLSWTPQLFSSFYNLYYAPHPQMSPIVSADLGNITGTFVPLAAGSSFYILLESRSFFGTGYYSNIMGVVREGH